MPVAFYQTGSEKHSEKKGVPLMWILFENGKYTIPYDDRCRKKVDVLVNELRGMAWDRGRVVSTSEHKDMVMSMWLAELGIGERSTINKVFDNQVLVKFILVGLQEFCENSFDIGKIFIFPKYGQIDLFCVY